MLDSILGFLGKGIDAFSSSSNTEKNNQTQLQIAAQNMAMQKEFAQMGIRWKVEDAKAAGLHPLAALGAQTSSFSPVSVGLDTPKTDFGGMGQDLGRAFKAAATAEERAVTDQAKERKLDLESKKLDNIMKSDAISTRRAGQLGPPLPRPGPIRTVDGLAVSEDDLKQKQGDIPAQKFSRPFGYPLYHNPYFSDGQVVEDRYGDSEILSTAKAAATLLADHAYTGYLAFPRNWSIRGGDRSRYRSRAREF